MLRWLKQRINNYILTLVESQWGNINSLNNQIINTKIGKSVEIYPKYKIIDSEIGDFTYIAESCNISLTTIGKFCSIGPNLISGWGIHPINGISTSPMFYSTSKQNGTTLTKENKIDERKHIKIGNDVFIGMNVKILDGITIGNGAIIGAGAIVSKDIPPYAIAVGSPIKILKYRFEPEIINKLLKIEWWDWEFDKLALIENSFFDLEGFINQNIVD